MRGAASGVRSVLAMAARCCIAIALAAVLSIFSGPAFGQSPGDRHGSAHWTTSDGALWVFGGYVDSGEAQGLRNDLWRRNQFDGAWTLVSGFVAADHPGLRETGSVASRIDLPSSRLGASAWVGPRDELWLFGGITSAGGGQYEASQEFWRFRPNQGWWMKVSRSEAAASLLGILFGAAGNTMTLANALLMAEDRAEAGDPANALLHLATLYVVIDEFEGSSLSSAQAHALRTVTNALMQTIHPVRVGGVHASIAAVGDGSASLPTDFALLDNYPNPFNPTTTIRFRLPQSEHVVVTVFDVAGRKIMELVSAQFTEGVHEVPWNGLTEAGHSAASGFYIYRVEAGAFVGTSGMTLLK